MNTTKRQKNRKHNTNKKQKIQQETVAQLHLDWDGELGWGTTKRFERTIWPSCREKFMNLDFNFIPLSDQWWTIDNHRNNDYEI